MIGSKPGFLYEIILNSNSNLAELISTLKLRLPDPQIYIYQNTNFYIFIETPLDRLYVCRNLANIISEDFIFQIAMPTLNNETILYFTFIPTVFKDFNAFEQYVSSFLNSFKSINLVPGAVYCVKCGNVYDATRLIAISRAIDFPGETYTKMLVDTYLFNMPIVQILNRNIDIATIERFANSRPVIFQDFGNSKILVFSDLLLAEKVIDIFNGGLLNSTFLIARHFASDSIINELQKYEVKFPLIDNSSQLNQHPEDRSHKKNALIENLKNAFNIAKEFGRVFSISCHTKQSNSKKYALVVFQNTSSSIRMVEQNIIPAKYSNLSFFISMFPPKTTEQDIMTLYSGIQPVSITKYRLKIKEEQQETYFLPFAKLKFDSIEKVDQALERNKTIKFANFKPFWFRRKEDFVNCYESITSKTSLFISNISDECNLDSLLEKCSQYGTIRLIAFTKTINTDLIVTKPAKLGFALVTYSKPNEMQIAKSQLNQLVFYGNHLNVKIPASIPNNNFYFENLTKVRSNISNEFTLDFPRIKPIPIEVFKHIIPLLREEIPDFAKKKS